jgi:lipopolysaccharide/colanic/teichoic acid biosynthesis glycosyltransferase
MSQVAVDSATLARSWNSDRAEEGELLHAVSSAEALLNIETTLDKRRTPAASVRAQSAISPCPLWKRLIDVGGSLFALIILAPVLLVIAAYIKCVSSGPVLFRHLRYGLDGRPFKVWKFRTIEVNDTVDEHQSHVADLMASNRPLEKRDHTLDVIPGGAFFRNFGIDELPQLINVLMGEMSLVGPRPDVVPFDQYEGWHRRRFDVLPGITGLWQVCGKNQTTFVEMMCLDATYVRRRSLWLDVRIILMTIPALAWD